MRRINTYTKRIRNTNILKTISLEKVSPKYSFSNVCQVCDIKAQVDTRKKKNYKDISNSNKKEMRHKRLDLTKKKKRKENKLKNKIMHISL